ncbi:MAG: TraB/GumN family protein [Acidobacteria bacterium]|nr:TraB/GumN family protein [Acidobacteriota bacterium]
MRGRQTMSAALAVALMALLVWGESPAASTAPVRAPLLWDVRIDGQQLWLFGTIHVPDARVLALPPAVREAFDASDRVVTEVAFDTVQQAELAAALMLPEGQRLRTILGEERFARLDARVRSALTPVAPQVAPLVAGLLDRLKPWAALAQLATLDYLPDLMAGRLALDAQLYADAVAAGKKAGGLETVAEQVGAFEAFTLEEQTTLMDDALREGGASGLAIPGATLVEWYLAGDDEKLATAMSQGVGDPALSRKVEQEILIKRNRRMADRIDALHTASPHEIIFVAVGALHLVGPDNLPQLLQARGYDSRRARP